MNHRLLRFFQGVCLYLVTVILCAGVVSAIGLGRIKVYSYLNEPLDAEIELLAATDAVDSLLISVASADEFERANVTRLPLLDKLMFQIIRDEDEVFIHATSKTWITEPYLDFLLNLSWGPGVAPGRLIRRYTILLDPIPPEGKPVYATRRLMPHSIEQPNAGANKKTRYAPSIADLASVDLSEAVAEQGVLLTDSSIPASIVAQTPQEKLSKLSNQGKLTTSSTIGAEAKRSSPEREHMHALFEHHDKPVDLKSLVDDVERVIVSSRSPDADIWFNEQTKEVSQSGGAEVTNKKMPVIAESAKTNQSAAPKPKAAKEATAQPAAAPQTGRANTPNLPSPEMVQSPDQKYELKNLIVLIGISVTVLALGIILWKRWRQRRQFSATRERLAQLSREAIEEERSTAFGGESIAPVGSSAPGVEEPINMADLDLVLAGDRTREPPSPTVSTPASVSIETPRSVPEALSVPVVEEIAINLDVLPGAAPPAVPVSDPEELNVKLQLARQYIDLGDFTSAKELLIMISTQGNATQRTEAQELLEKII